MLDNRFNCLLLQAKLAILLAAQWRLLRTDAAAHLLAMHLAVVAALPGSHADRWVPAEARHVLQVRSHEQISLHTPFLMPEVTAERRHTRSCC